MKRDGKLHVTLHILAHLTEAGARPTTSEELAEHLHTNSVVIRRALATLREAGIVGSVKGHGGGWTLARPATAISLGAVYGALGERVALAPNRTSETPICLIERSVADALGSYYAEAEALLVRRLDEVSLADIAADYRQRRAAYEATLVHADVPSG